jgi:hypothetical protein
LLKIAAMKKERERLYLDAFLISSPELVVSEISSSEEPDFLVRMGGRTIGIELTSFFFPQKGGVPHAARDRYRDLLQDTLQHEQRVRGLPAMYLSVHLAESADYLTKSGRASLTRLIVDFVAARVPPVGSEISPEPTRELYQAGVSTVHIYRSQEITKAQWTLPYASFIPESKSELIQRIVDEKNANVARYRRNAEEVWLLIVSGTAGLLSMIDLDNDVSHATYKGDFERLQLLKGRVAHSLAIQPCEHSDAKTRKIDLGSKLRIPKKTK